MPRFRSGSRYPARTPTTLRGARGLHDRHRNRTAHYSTASTRPQAAASRSTVSWPSATTPMRPPPGCARQLRRFVMSGWHVMSELPDPRSFDPASRQISEDTIAEVVPCGPDIDRHLAAARKFTDADFTHLAFVQVGGRRPAGPVHLLGRPRAAPGPAETRVVCPARPGAQPTTARRAVWASGSPPGATEHKLSTGPGFQRHFGEAAIHGRRSSPG